MSFNVHLCSDIHGEIPVVVTEEAAEEKTEEAAEDKNAQAFCPGLTEAVLNQIVQDEFDKDDELVSLNIKEWRSAVSSSLEKSLMTLFLHHYGWSQMGEAVSLNPFKTIRSMRSGMRMIYDAYMEALTQSSICRQWFSYIGCK